MKTLNTAMIVLTVLASLLLSVNVSAFEFQVEPDLVREAEVSDVGKGYGVELDVHGFSVPGLVNPYNKSSYFPVENYDGSPNGWKMSTKDFSGIHLLYHAYGIKDDEITDLGYKESETFWSSELGEVELREDKMYVWLSDNPYVLFSEAANKEDFDAVIVRFCAAVGYESAKPTERSIGEEEEKRYTTWISFGGPETGIEMVVNEKQKQKEPQSDCVAPTVAFLPSGKIVVMTENGEPVPVDKKWSRGKKRPGYKVH